MTNMLHPKKKKKIDALEGKHRITNKRPIKKNIDSTHVRPLTHICRVLTLSYKLSYC